MICICGGQKGVLKTIFLQEKFLQVRIQDHVKAVENTHLSSGTAAFGRDSKEVLGGGHDSFITLYFINLKHLCLQILCFQPAPT